ncbi:MAG TPA: ubiquinol-cytochrome c reductase iron-sulfur subunit [Nitrospirae bacterium]|nr:ubiquinol-cytochrome c reductase iron-sulfur subunit [Nitrospirota bacterium]
MTRHELLKYFISYCLSSIIFVFIVFFYFISPQKVKNKKIKYVFLFDEDDLPKRGVKKVEYKFEHNGKVHFNRCYIVFHKSNYLAFSPVCTHLGCHVNWDSINKEFICPCHSGRFDMTGQVIDGPPREPLKTMPLKIENYKVYLGISL